MRERIRVVCTLPSNDDHRCDYPMRRINQPLRTLAEVAEITGLTWEQVRYCEENALQKLKAALSAYGYHKERQR